jgi:hypothetical protein
MRALKRSGAAVAFLVVAYLLAELACLVVLVVRTRSASPLVRLQAARAQIVAAQPSRARAGARFVSERMLHPYLGYVTDPDVAIVHWVPHANGYGFVDRSQTIYKRRPDTVLIGIAGGSMGLNLAAVARPLFDRELAKDARFAGKKRVYVALAMGGYKAPQQLMSLTYLLAAGGELDLLINVDGFNDVALHEVENAPKGTSILYPRAWFAELADLGDRTLSRLATELEDLERERVEGARRFSAQRRRHSPLANVVWLLADRRLATRIAAAEQQAREYQPAKQPSVLTGPPATYADDAALYQALADLWERDSLQLERLCRANGIAYFHFLQPNQYDEGGKTLSAAERAVAFDEHQPYAAGVRKGYPLLRERGRRLAASGVRFSDLTMIFADHPEPLYIDTCCHVGEAGDQLLFRTMTETIRRGLRDDELKLR